MKLPEGPFDVVLADPPWSYRVNHATDLRGTASEHYATQDEDWILSLPVADVMASDAVLVLWATWPCLGEALRVMQAWGFELKTGLPWVKTYDGEHPCFGVGFWLRGCTEPVLIGTRGSPRSPHPNAPLGIVVEGEWPERQPGLFTRAPRLDHSRKPDDIYHLAEQLAPGERRLELFARNARNGWTSWGNDPSLNKGDK